jgi:Protein of unknown function (DUF3592)
MVNEVLPTRVKVQGTVIHSEVTLSDGYFADIKYTFCIDGREYTGDQVRNLAVFRDWQGPARRLCERYPVGCVVDVFVDPKFPADAVLENPSHADLLRVVFAISIVLVLLAALILFFVVRQ